MVWEKRIRRISWVFFLLMWIPLGFVVFSPVMEDEEPPITALALFFFLCIASAILFVGSFGIGSLEEEEIKKKGIAAKAAIVSISETGTRINDQPLLRIGLEVQPPYNSRFTATVEYVVPYSFLPRVQPSNVVKVYNLEDAKGVALADL